MPRHKEFNPDRATQEAMEAFWERGYNATSVRDLLSEMKLNRGSLYGTFGDKKTLFLAALDRYDKQRLEAFKEMIERPGPAKAAIREWVLAAAQCCTGEEGRRGCLAAKAAMEVASHDKDVAAWLKRVNGRNERMVAAVLARGKERGEFAPAMEPRSTARFLLCALGGLWLMGAISPPRKDVAEVVDLILKILDC